MTIAARDRQGAGLDQECLQGEPLVRGHVPTCQPRAQAGEHVHDDRQVGELLPEPHIRNIRDPDVIEACDLQTLDQVRVASV